MVSNENQFFGNKKIPYCLKAGVASVLLHSTVDYYVTPESQTAFMSMFFDKDINDKGQTTRSVSGTLSFTFGKPESMGMDNCQASIKKLVDLYPSVGDVFDHIAENSTEKLKSNFEAIIFKDSIVKLWEPFSQRATRL